MTNNKLNYFKYFLRILSIALMFFFFYTLVGVSIDGLHVSLYANIKKIILSVICSVGLWVITTNWAKRWRWISTLLYLPVLLILPLAFWLYSSIFLIISFILFILILFIFFPWRKADGQSIKTQN